MEEEHQKDREAFDRLLRFLPDDEEEAADGEATADSEVESEDSDESAMVPYISARRLRSRRSQGQSLLHAIESVMRDDRDRTWNVRQLIESLESRGRKLTALRPESTVSVALKKLSDRGKITLVALGSGRKPHTYQWSQRRLPVDGNSEEEG